MLRAGVVALVSIAACADVPASPTYADDVRTILLANCVRCHRAPDDCTDLDRRGYRLDHWGDVGDVAGVAATTEQITVQAVELARMPTTGPLSEREREILRRWQRAGSPRGEPAVNEPSTLDVTTAIPEAEPEDQRVRLAYDVRDPDGDRVTWSVGWRRDGVDGALTGPLGEGHGEAVLDLGVLASGSYQLVARVQGELDDEATEVTLGDPIAIGPRAAAPSVRLRSPRGREGFTRGGTLDVIWEADDVDSPGPVTATVRLVDDSGATTELATGLDAHAGQATIQLDAAVPPGEHVLEIVVSDGALERTDRTGCPVTIRP